MEEENVEFAAAHIDAMKETANQILGSISKTLKSTDETAFSVTDLNCKEVELNAEMFDKPDLAVATFSLKIGNDEAKNVVSVMTAKLHRRIAWQCGGRSCRRNGRCRKGNGSGR